MGKPDTIRIKARVNVGGMKPGDVKDVRAGYALTLIRVGYATRLDNLADALSAEPLRYGDWEDDPRGSEEVTDG